MYLTVKIFFRYSTLNLSLAYCRCFTLTYMISFWDVLTTGVVQIFSILFPPHPILYLGVYLTWQRFKYCFNQGFCTKSKVQRTCSTGDWWPSIGLIRREKRTKSVAVLSLTVLKRHSVTMTISINRWKIRRKTVRMQFYELLNFRIPWIFYSHELTNSINFLISWII